MRARGLCPILSGVIGLAVDITGTQNVRLWLCLRLRCCVMLKVNENIWVYKLDGGAWAVALNPKSNCQIWHFKTRERAMNKANELSGVSVNA